MLTMIARHVLLYDVRTVLLRYLQMLANASVLCIVACLWSPGTIDRLLDMILGILLNHVKSTCRLRAKCLLYDLSIPMASTAIWPCCSTDKVAWPARCLEHQALVRQVAVRIPTCGAYTLYVCLQCCLDSFAIRGVYIHTKL